MNQAVDALLSLPPEPAAQPLLGRPDDDGQTVEALLNLISDRLALRHRLALIYRQAASRIDQFGWIQRAGVGLKGEMCAGNAVVRSAWELNPLGCPLVIEVFKAWIGTSHFNGIEMWNDAPQRTKEEVTKTLRALADYLTAPPPEAYLG